MRVFFTIVLIIFGFMAIYLIATNPYTNPYKLIMIFGKKGSGKSTILTKYAIQYIKKGWTVYSTEHIPGVYFIQPEYIGKFNLKDYNYKPIDPDDYRGIKKLLVKLRLKFFPHKPKVLLLIDEVGIIYDNRNFKNFNTKVRDFFKLQRHYYVKCVMFSQTFDVDKKLRDLTDAMYLVKNVARVFCYGKKIRKYQNISNDSMDGSGGKIVDDYEFEPFILFFVGSRTLTYIPKYSKSFNSFLAPKLPDIEFQCVTYDRDNLPDISDEDKSDQDNPDDDKPNDSDAAIEKLPEDEDKIEENEPDKNTALQEEGRVQAYKPDGSSKCAHAKAAHGADAERISRITRKARILAVKPIFIGGSNLV